MPLAPRRRGFTLIELLVVLVIIGILAAIGLNRYRSARQRSLVVAVMNDLRNLATHQESYFGRHMAYAAAPTDLPGFAVQQGVTLTITSADNQGFAARATHGSLGSFTCGLFVGEAAAADAVPATAAGVVACQ